jgi:DNA-binding SARP family transcriptional activator/tetratricopeptide (TPR) repeat protein
VEFALLGPVEAHGPRGPVELGGPRGQSVLAALLLNANRVVSLDALVDAVWGDQAPASARTQVQNRVSALRKALDAVELIVTEGSGYSIRVEDGRLDIDRFGRAVLDADTLAPTEPLRAAEKLAAGLALWRGPALDGLPTPYLRAAAQHLEERRMIALGKRIQLDLDLGRHADLVPELTRLTSLHPFREDLCGLLMLALYRTGRQAAALDAFRNMRLALDEQLGVTPGTELRNLHESILRGDDRLLWTAGGPVEIPGRAVPRSLPADITDFTGRAGELTALDGALHDDSTGVPIVAITGTAGVGKTALAVHWVHRVANRFPDGQLYLDLCGYASRSPLRPVDALGSLLRALGTPPDQVPLDVAEAAALFRSRLAGRRMLLLLDNAGSVDQVRPLLPGSPGSLVIVTSRERLGGLVALHGAHRVSLDVLNPEEARELFARLIGERRMLAEPDAATELAGVCAYLPLALRIAAAHLADRPHRGIAEYVSGLRDDNRLSALAIDGDEDAAVRITLDLSYQTIPASAQRMFRLLGCVPGVDFTPEVAAALAEVPPHEATALLNRLAGAHLVFERSPHRYAFHDLLREYARERADAEGETDALGRLLDWYLGKVFGARDLLHRQLVHLPPPPLASVPGFASTEAALSWLDSEHRNLIAVIEHAAVHGPRRTAWLLADGLRGYLSQRSPKADWLTACQTALSAARTEQDPGGQAAMHASLAQVEHWRGRNHAAIDHLRNARTLALRGGWTVAEAHITGNLGIVLQEIGLAEQAENTFTEALALCRRNGPPVGEAIALNNLGNFYRRGGRLHAAAACVTHALDVYGRIGGVAGGAAAALDSLARVYHDLGQLDRARTLATEAVAQHRRLGNSESESIALLGLAEIHTDRADYRSALDCAEAGLRMSDKPGNWRARGMALTALAAVLNHLGRRAEAISHYEQALATAAETQTRYTQIVALTGLAHSNPTAPTAVDLALEALTLADRGGFPILAGRAMTTLAELLLLRRLTAKATDYARWALHRAHQTRHPLDQARANTTLNRCHHS